jgi:hypothetical protein
MQNEEKDASPARETSSAGFRTFRVFAIHGMAAEATGAIGFFILHSAFIIQRF